MISRTKEWYIRMKKNSYVHPVFRLVFAFCILSFGMFLAYCGYLVYTDQIASRSYEEQIEIFVVYTIPFGLTGCLLFGLIYTVLHDEGEDGMGC